MFNSMNITNVDDLKTKQKKRRIGDGMKDKTSMYNLHSIFFFINT